LSPGSDCRIGKYNQIPPSPDLDRWNSYGSYDFSAKNLLFTDGSADPWREVSYHATRAPQRYWNDRNPEHLINGAVHAWDMYARKDIEEEPQFIRETHYLEQRTIGTWLKKYHNQKYKL
jgi:hypothetical protein